ncbi:DUF4397 domain-containing protein [Mesonia maritima]|uniref:Secreted protein (Por secretion system target) n=1 Tax=Mesonia maritima TaxID=1793873 RepID=A0ABU1KBV1_9FLAO|nr:DUF4397 domain-containing protein [Mesonia maritima]MDR6302053.1 hypothetical protein [Mesonia maritima]
MKKITLTFVCVFFAQLLFAQTARVQIIHNSPDAAVQEVDVYINGNLELDDFEFRTATPFVDLPAGVTLTIDVAPNNSTSASDAIASFNFNLASNETYIAIADGIVSTTGYNPSPSFDIEVYPLGQEAAANPSEVDVLVYHGSTDAPTVDIVETGVGAGVVVDDISYTNFDGYLQLPVADYTLEVQDASNTTTIASYEAPLSTLGLTGGAAVALASGFVDPSVNSGGPEFGIWVALPTGGNLVELANSTARLQVIHNSADAAASTVDLYLNGEMLQDNFEFRTATPFLDFPAGVEAEIAVAPGNSTDVSDAIATFPVTLQANETYIAVADGIVSPTGYNPAPAFGLEVYSGARETAMTSGNVDVLVHHGSTDAPTVDVVETGIGAGTLVDDISYTDFQGYLELGVEDYTIDIRDENNTTTVASYLAPLSTLNLQDQALTVVASGFLDPSVNSDGEGFGLWVATANGGDMIPLPENPLSVNNFEKNNIALYPNPTDNVLTINGLVEASYEVRFFDMQGRMIKNVEVENGNSIPSISLGDLNSGVYQVAIYSENNLIESKRLIKK